MTSVNDDPLLHASLLNYKEWTKRSTLPRRNLHPQALRRHVKEMLHDMMKSATVDEKTKLEAGRMLLEMIGARKKPKPRPIYRS